MKIIFCLYALNDDRLVLVYYFTSSSYRPSRHKLCEITTMKSFFEWTLILLSFFFFWRFVIRCLFSSFLSFRFFFVAGTREVNNISNDWIILMHIYDVVSFILTWILLRSIIICLSCGRICNSMKLKRTDSFACT